MRLKNRSGLVRRSMAATRISLLIVDFFNFFQKKRRKNETFLRFLAHFELYIVTHSPFFSSEFRSHTHFCMQYANIG